MVTEDHKELIQKAVSTKDKAVIDAAFQKVLHEEIGRISKTSNVVQDYICELASVLNVPYKYDVTSRNREVKNEDSIKNDSKSVGVSLIILIGIAIISSEFGKVLGVCFSIVCAVGLYYYLHLLRTKNCSASTKQEYLIIETIEAEAVINLVEEFINKIRPLIDEVTIQCVSPQKPIILPLHKCYPNVLKWFQNLYSDSLFFDEKTKEHLIKRIETIMYSCQYEIVIFNGNNSNMFEINYNKNIDKPQMAEPAFIYSKTGKVVLPGVVTMPN